MEERIFIVGLSQIWGVIPQGRRSLAGAEMDKDFGHIDNAYVEISMPGGTVASMGTMDTLDRSRLEGATVLSGHGRMLIPAFADSHTHLVYAGSREGEFEDKIRGLSYEEIAARGGGILNSADRLHRTTDNELFMGAMGRLAEIASKGTAAVEIKSGYGLKESSPLEIKATFLGAHAVGREYTGRQQEYVDMLIADMLPAVAAEGLAEYVDVFCDRGFFTVEQTDAILEAASRYGFRPKIHANELDISGGVQVGVAHGALSVDHLERIGQDEIDVLRRSSTVATRGLLLPGPALRACPNSG